jgi:hypothetical protein
MHNIYKDGFVMFEGFAEALDGEDADLPCGHCVQLYPSKKYF